MQHYYYYALQLKAISMHISNVSLRHKALNNYLYQ